MENALPSLALLGCVVITLAIVRRRSLLAHIAVEAGLLLAIGAFLVWRGSSPLPYVGAVPVGLMGAWTRALAVIWWLIGARLVVSITVFARGRDPKSRNARLFSDLAAAVVYITATLIILNSVLGLNVKGLLVTSGVIAIVLGLALQNTLADVFSGIAVGLEQPFKVGDEVSVGDGVEGVIVQINWRSLRVQTDDDNLATVPNSVVSKAPIINRSAPTRRQAASVEIVAPAHAPSDTVIELMQQATLLCASILPKPLPTITIRRSGLFSATYAVRFFVADSADLSPAKTMLLRQTRRLFRHAGIGHATPLSTSDLLRSLPLFQALPAEDLESLAQALIVHAVEPGDTIFQQGATATSLYVVQAGVMETTHHSPVSKAETLNRVGAGDYIGELGLIASAPRACTVKALTRGRILELPGSPLTRLLQSNPALDATMKRFAQQDRASIAQADVAAVELPPRLPENILTRAKALLGL